MVASQALKVPDNITLLPLPACALELNPVENVWEYLRQNKLAIRLYETHEAILEACCQAWNDLIAMPARLGLHHSTRLGKGIMTFGGWY